MKAFGKPFLICLLSFIGCAGLRAQEFLEIDLSNKCIYSGNQLDEELYAFKTSVSVMETLVAEILLRGGELERNFELVQTNVSNVTAVIDQGKRYLLWSQDFIEGASALEAYGSVAHEIGHHVNNHTLTAAKYKEEEAEADFFMGYILRKNKYADFTKKSIKQFLYDMPKRPGTHSFFDSRFTIVEKGFDKADASLRLPGANFDEDPSMVNFLHAQFPFPPPKCHTAYEIPRETFARCITLGDVGQNISKALESRKYPFSYLSVPNGFALVAQLEQYDKDGSIIASDHRWTDYPLQESFSFSWNYLQSLIYPRKGYLRIFAFIITSQNYSTTQERVSKAEATAWLSMGVNRLPKKVIDSPFTKDYAVSLLVYEFEVPESNHRAEQSCPCRFQALEHLTKSGLAGGLKPKP